VVRAILAYNAGRDPELVELKYKAMRADPFVFLRGNCHLFYSYVEKLGSLRKAPAAWNCGDLHLENFGSFRGANGLVYFDMNDFDEALLAPCIWDLLRLGASVLVAHEKLGVSEVGALNLARELIEVYATTLINGKALWVERDRAQGAIGRLLNDLKGQSRDQLIDKRTFLDRSGKPRLKIDGGRALPADKAAQAKAKQILRAASVNGGKLDFKVRDIARRIAGTGSLGLERYIALIELKRDQSLRLVDIKVAKASSSVDAARQRQPKWQDEAQRVVAVARRCQAVSPAWLSNVARDGSSYVLRELQPREDRFNLSGLARDPEAIRHIMHLMGRLLAWAQLRASGRQGSANADDLITFAQGGKWRKVILRLMQDLER
jgi:uncharacterized protein (DUF2252 family)